MQKLIATKARIIAMIKRTSFILSGMCILLLTGCKGDTEHNDLKQYVAELRRMPKREIPALPEIQTYQSFTYQASGLRSPFEEAVTKTMHSAIFSNIKPDMNRKKQFLEKFAFDTFTMVGTLQKASGAKGLIKINDNIYLVSEGDYLGRNHGRIVHITEKEIQIMEIVPASAHSWIERPRRLILK